jgi:hypothetical protein
MNPDDWIRYRYRLEVRLTALTGALSPMTRERAADIAKLEAGIRFATRQLAHL